MESYVETAQKNRQFDLDAIDDIVLQSPSLDLLATGKFHASYESSSEPRYVDQAELFSFPRRLMTGRLERFLRNLVSIPYKSGWPQTGYPATHGGFIMLVLTRRVGEEIVIDGNIRVVVTAVKGLVEGSVGPPHLPSAK